ncbi:MAG: D-cysteine desulfhydrase family protein [Dehalococcoidales bacterium]|nr:D-cysteine desulfhydrase family protein [Dehalococcoidales bacterium]
MSIVKLPRVDLGYWPTPLHELTRLSDVLSGPRIFVKRDDLSGLALGGNKFRKLEYVLADARQRGIDTVVTVGSSQSNSALEVAAASRKLGLEPYLLLFKGVHPEKQGNLLLANILNTTMELFEVADPREMFTTMLKKASSLADRLRGQGRNPLILPVGVTMPLGVVGWVSAAEEIVQQLKKLEIETRHLILANGSGGTQAGLVLGFKYLKSTMNVVGISVVNHRNEATAVVVDQANAAAELLGLDIIIKPEEVTIYDDYLGQGYGIPTREGIEAIRLVAQTEAIFLDPVYTGKAMAGLIDLINKGVFTKADTMLFVHTGGVAADFAYNQELSD